MATVVVEAEAELELRRRGEEVNKHREGNDGENLNPHLADHPKPIWSCSDLLWLV